MQVSFKPDQVIDKLHEALHKFMSLIFIWRETVFAGRCEVRPRNS